MNLPEAGDDDVTRVIDLGIFFYFLFSFFSFLLLLLLERPPLSISLIASGIIGDRLGVIRYGVVELC